MSDFMKICQQRQTCREFADKPVEHDKLVSCVEAGRMAPSGCNAQPWKFIVVEKPEVAAKVAECAQPMGMNPYAAGARAFLVLLEEHAVLMPKIACMIDSQYFARGDVGAAAAYFCLEAAAQGLATCQFGMFDRAKLGEILGLPANQRYAALIGVGYAANPEIRPKQRKPIGEVARFV